MGGIIATPLAVIFGVLTSPSDLVFWTKWAWSYVHLNLFRAKRRLDVYDMFAENDAYKTGMLYPDEEITLESPLPENELLTTVDEVFFYGTNSKSEYLIVNITRGVNGKAEAWLRLKLANGKTYILKEAASFQQTSCDERTFSCGDLQLCFLLPMRTWRIFYNGMLCETSDNSKTSTKMVHVKLALLWRASSDVFDFTSDINDTSLCTGLANAKWSSLTPPIEKFRKAMNGYSQSGAIAGTVAVEDEEEDVNLYLFGARIRCLSDLSCVKGVQFRHVFGQTRENGRIIQLTEMSISNVVENFTFGVVVEPTGALRTVSDQHFSIDKQLNCEDSQSKLTSNFKVRGKLFQFESSLVKNISNFRCQEEYGDGLNMNYMEFSLNGIEGNGVTLSRSIHQSTKKTKKNEEKKITHLKAIPLVTHFTDEICQDSQITGGKGSSLGKLTCLSKTFQNFVVPEGFVVTTAAYKELLTENVKNQIKHLEDVLYGNTKEDLKMSCEQVSNLIVESIMPSSSQKAIAEALQKAFHNEKHEIKFAVRSSATGEDTEQMSAAGQMDTYLGVTGLDKIILSVKKCWASQFSYIAVQYKKQNGQIINSPMAVVVQRMVPCDVAGVLFTCDPLSGNPSLMSITANYGLGESVVSGSEEPDTIVLKRDSEDNLQVKDKIIGAKSRRIIVKDDEGTDIEEVSESQRESCCLNDEMSLRLGLLAIRIEKSYRSRRDIEWGFWNNNLYIFQSRPVTSGSGETDFEIDHEFDGAMRIEGEYYAVCNVGEVMPGSTSPLGLDVLFKYFSVVFQRSSLVSWQQDMKPKYFPKGMVTQSNHVMFYLLDMFERMTNDREMVQAGMVGLFGRYLDEEEIFQVADKRYKDHTQSFRVRWNSRILIWRMMIRLIYKNDHLLKQARKFMENYRFPVENYKSSQELFHAITSSVADSCITMAAHMVCSESSSIWNMMLFGSLKAAKGKIDEDVYVDFSELITTNSAVESADVPAAIEELALHIADDIKPELFKAMTIEKAEEWLKTTNSKSGKRYKEFLRKHGHRCLKEFDIHTHSWSINAKTLIQFLQNLVGNDKKESEKKRSKTFQEIMSNLKIPLGFKSRLFMRFAIPRSRRAVQNREMSKSLLIRSVDTWRKAFNHLSKMMQSEGRIPDAELLFFMTMQEIKDLFRTRSPKIISKAIHRRKRHAVLDSYIFPEIMKGFPQPVNMHDTSLISNDENFSMKGIPVSQGLAKGFVRVAITLEEASHLKPGEILLTYSTDIGWSPYFPMLAGVVTELGGLISHGAVVSREYGIPCIAGLHGATRQFQTGDYVLLDGSKGLLKRISKPETT